MAHCEEALLVTGWFDRFAHHTAADLRAYLAVDDGGQEALANGSLQGSKRERAHVGLGGRIEDADEY